MDVVNPPVLMKTEVYVRPRSTKAAWLVGAKSYRETEVVSGAQEGKAGHFSGSGCHLLLLES